MPVETPELISDDPRKLVEAGPDQFPKLYAAAVNQYGTLLPGNLLGFCLGLSNQRARQLITGGHFTRVMVCGCEFVPMCQVEARIYKAELGKLSKGGRGNRVPQFKTFSAS